MSWLLLRLVYLHYMRHWCVSVLRNSNTCFAFS